jgi:hypothetical protein
LSDNRVQGASGHAPGLYSLAAAGLAVHARTRGELTQHRAGGHGCRPSRGLATACPTAASIVLAAATNSSRVKPDVAAEVLYVLPS